MPLVEVSRVQDSGGVAEIWRSRSPAAALSCDPGDDYIHSLRGHNWDSWMARADPPHSASESYRGATPRVPCDGYWRTGPRACPAVLGSPASVNFSLQELCSSVLDNGYERGRELPAGKSRLEGWPHLGPGAEANGGRVLPPNSPWPHSYPLSADGSAVEQVGTLELLALLARGTARSTSSFSSSSSQSERESVGGGGVGGGEQQAGTSPASTGEGLDASPATMNRFAANFGANDGKTSDPVAVLYRDGWRGVAVELEERFCDSLRFNLGHTNASIQCPLGVTPPNAPRLLEAASAPLDLDYLKIDIDSYDCDVLASILAAGYRPKVIQMETGTIPPPVRFASHFLKGYTRPHAQIFQAFGCSLSYVEDLLQAYAAPTGGGGGGDAAGSEGAKKEGGGHAPYTLIEAGLDSIWVRRDVLSAATVATHAETRDGRLLRRMASQPDLLTAYVNGFWRWPWRRELHVWEIGTEHWFLLSEDSERLEALRDHMACVDACFHSPDYHSHHHRSHLHPRHASSLLPPPPPPRRPRHHHRQQQQRQQQQQQQQQPDSPPSPHRRSPGEARTLLQLRGGGGGGGEGGGGDDEQDGGFTPSDGDGDGRQEEAEGGSGSSSNDDDDWGSGGGGGPRRNVHAPFHYTLSLEPLALTPPFPGDPAHFSPATHGRATTATTPSSSSTASPPPLFSSSSSKYFGGGGGGGGGGGEQSAEEGAHSNGLTWRGKLAREGDGDDEEDDVSRERGESSHGGDLSWAP